MNEMLRELGIHAKEAETEVRNLSTNKKMKYFLLSQRA